MAEADGIKVRVNGAERRLPPGTRVQGLLERLEVEAERVAVERNRRLVRRAEFAREPLEDGDEVEVVTLVGGG